MARTISAHAMVTLIDREMAGVVNSFPRGAVGETTRSDCVAVELIVGKSDGGPVAAESSMMPTLLP
jgi:hypothetical protein